MNPEPAVQRRFSIPTFVQGVLLAAAVLHFPTLLAELPDREELGARIAPITFDRATLPESGFRPLRLVGAWSLQSPDPRFGGLSALAVDGTDLVAVTDSATIVRFLKPALNPTFARLDEVPGGPGSPGFKRRRDSEILLRDPVGRGWWVGFEFANALWLYDAQFRRVLGSVSIKAKGWGDGFEAALFAGRELIVFPESGGKALVIPPRGKPRFLALDVGPIADAQQLPDGSILLVERKATALGFRNSLVQVVRDGAAFRVRRTYRLDLPPVENVEGLAVEPRPDGTTRLWLVTDDGFEWPMRTLLVAFDLPRT